MLNDKLAIFGGEPASNKFLPFGAPCFGEEEISEVVETIKSGWIGMGKKTQLFEERFAEYVGAKYAVAVSSCTAALELCLALNGIGPGDEVITTPMTFVATANSILYRRATPVFVDINYDTLNIDPSLIEAAITSKTKAIIPVHFGGLPCDMDSIEEIAKKYKLTVIEDAAHAVGARYNGKMIGDSENFVCFSFYPNKNLSTAEGGMITFFSEEMAERARILRQHGLNRDAWKRFGSKQIVNSDMIDLGFKYNMTDLQASLALPQLEKQEKFLTIREEMAKKYDAAFLNYPGIKLQFRPKDIHLNRHAIHLYVLLIDPAMFNATRDEISEAIRAENIGTGVHYSPVHLETYYREHFGYASGLFKNAERVGESTLTLPLTPSMDKKDIANVISGTIKVLNFFKK